MRNTEPRPAVPARIAAWGITFLLTVMLTITALGGPAAVHRVLTSEELHIRTATEDSVIQEQMDRIAGSIRDIAEEYGFSADDVTGMISREEIADVNNRAASWWTNIVSEGVMDEIPAWTVSEEINNIILNAMDTADIPEEEQEETAKGAANEIEKAVNRTVMPFRKALITLAFRYVSKKTDLPGIIRFVSRVPQCAAAASLLLAGVIAFLLGKRIRFSLKYYGAAFAGAGLSALTGILIIRGFDISGMIRASSERLDHQVQSMMRAVVTETWICAAALFVLGMGCLLWYNHLAARADHRGGAYETKENHSQDPVAQDP